jgi:hypothetical protein
MSSNFVPSNENRGHPLICMSNLTLPAFGEAEWLQVNESRKIGVAPDGWRNIYAIA